jgi:hypothetical protein
MNPPDIYLDHGPRSCRRVPSGAHTDRSSPPQHTKHNNTSRTRRDVVEFVRTSTDRTEATIRTILPDLTNYMPESMAEYSPHGPGGKVADFFYRAWPQVIPNFWSMLCVPLAGMLACFFAPRKPYPVVQSQTLNAKKNAPPEVRPKSPVIPRTLYPLIPQNLNLTTLNPKPQTPQT